jgi:hypothetical protein
LKFEITDGTAVIFESSDLNKDFLSSFKNVYTKLKQKNIILILSESQILNNNLIENILKIPHTHNKGKYSFVFVSDHPDPNEIKAEISWAPTLQEAFDIIEIEEIQRDLEF